MYYFSGRKNAHSVSGLLKSGSDDYSILDQKCWQTLIHARACNDTIQCHILGYINYYGQNRETIVFKIVSFHFKSLYL